MNGETTRLRALVVEDEWSARNYMVELLEASRLSQVVGAVATVDEALEAIAPTSGLGVDVAFVDLHLAGSDGDRGGLTLARRLSEAHPHVRVVLATAYQEHALEAYALGVVDYVLKPISEERIAQCLERLVLRRAPAPAGSRRIVARRRKSLVFLDLDEIWAFEAADRLTFVHTRHGRFDLDLSLAAIELSFGRTLTRVHRCWLVAAAQVKELAREGSETSLFVGESLSAEGVGVWVPVARDRAQTVRDLLLLEATGLRRGPAA